MTILGIETSTAVCSVGLIRQSVEHPLQSEKSIIESHIHSEKLLTLVQEVCDEQQIKLSQLDGIAVSIGPGSFTGLRIGLSAAKGLCFSLEKPLLAVPTFQSMATSVLMTHPDCERVLVCIDAKQREYYIGAYEQINGTVREVLEIHIGSIASALPLVRQKTIIVTDAVSEVKKESRDSIWVEEVFSHCHGDIIARVGLENWSPQSSMDWKQLEPRYLKDFVVKVHKKSED
jgi:tRNA threonylcarbamoyladenosine biosynthesis protein TsaB